MSETVEDKFARMFEKLLQSGKLESVKEEILTKIRDLNLKTKSEDYNSNGVNFVDYWPELTRDIFLAVHGKTLRLKSLVGRDGPVLIPNHESIEDTSLDLAAYSIWLGVLNRLEEQVNAVAE